MIGDQFIEQSHQLLIHRQATRCSKTLRSRASKLLSARNHCSSKLLFMWMCNFDEWIVYVSTIDVIALWIDRLSFVNGSWPMTMAWPSSGQAMASRVGCEVPWAVTYEKWTIDKRIIDGSISHWVFSRSLVDGDNFFSKNWQWCLLRRDVKSHNAYRIVVFRLFPSKTFELDKHRKHQS